MPLHGRSAQQAPGPRRDGLADPAGPPARRWEEWPGPLRCLSDLMAHSRRGRGGVHDSLTFAAGDPGDSRRKGNFLAIPGRVQLTLPG